MNMDGYYSTKKAVTLGVPQGSILGLGFTPGIYL